MVASTPSAPVLAPTVPTVPTVPPASPVFYGPDTLHPDTSVGLLMKRAVQSMRVLIDRRLAEHDLTHAQWLPLFHIARGGGDTVATLARDQAMDPGAMTRAIDRLEAKGLLRRERAQHDRRVVRLVLTDAGREAARPVPAVLAEVLNAHLAGFSAAEWQQLIHLLGRLVANGDALRGPLTDGE
jgi:DNA-binding MarR family transcriptional regulator